MKFFSWFRKKTKSNLVAHAEQELDLIGMTKDSPDKINRAMRKHIIHMISEFSKEGHSGMSAAYATNVINTLMKFNPISPLTGEDSEWIEITDGLYQNKRCSCVFKDEKGPYDIEGKIFQEPYKDEDGIERYHCYTNNKSRVRIKFPYTPTKRYVKVSKTVK